MQPDLNLMTNLIGLKCHTILQVQKCGRTKYQHELVGGGELVRQWNTSCCAAVDGGLPESGTVGGLYVFCGEAGR